MVPRQWQRESELRDLSPLLVAMDELAERVTQAAQGDSHRVIALGHKLAGLYNELALLERRGDILLQRQQQELEAMALGQITSTRDRLKAFTAESWAGLGDLQNAILREQRGRQVDEDQSTLPRSSE